MGCTFLSPFVSKLGHIQGSGHYMVIRSEVLSFGAKCLCITVISPFSFTFAEDKKERWW